MPPSPWFDSSDISTFRTGLISMLSPDPANQKIVFLATHRSLKWTPALDPVVCILSITNRPSFQFFVVERGGPVCGRSVVGPTALEKLQDFKVLKWIPRLRPQEPGLLSLTSTYPVPTGKREVWRWES